jgi:hypothetical protein
MREHVREGENTPAKRGSLLRKIKYHKDKDINKTLPAKGTSIVVIGKMDPKILMPKMS